MFSAFDYLFDYATSPSLNTYSTYRWSNSEVKENDKEYSIRLEIPGFSDKDLTVNVRDGMLHLYGKVDAKDDPFVGNKSFDRKYYLPNQVDVDNILAEVKNGVLVVRLPKVSVNKLGKQIPIKVLS